MTQDLVSQHNDFWNTFRIDEKQITKNESFIKQSAEWQKKTLPKEQKHMKNLYFIYEFYGVHDFSVIMNSLTFSRTRNQTLIMIDRLVKNLLDDSFQSFPVKWQAKIMGTKNYNDAI